MIDFDRLYREVIKLATEVADLEPVSADEENVGAFTSHCTFRAGPSRPVRWALLGVTGWGCATSDAKRAGFQVAIDRPIHFWLVF